MKLSKQFVLGLFAVVLMAWACSEKSRQLITDEPLPGPGAELPDGTPPGGSMKPPDSENPNEAPKITVSYDGALLSDEEGSPVPKVLLGRSDPKLSIVVEDPDGDAISKNLRIVGGNLDIHPDDMVYIFPAVEDTCVGASCKFSFSATDYFQPGEYLIVLGASDEPSEERRGKGFLPKQTQTAFRLHFISKGAKPPLVPNNAPTVTVYDQGGNDIGNQIIRVQGDQAGRNYQFRLEAKDPDGHSIKEEVTLLKSDNIPLSFQPVEGQCNTAARAGECTFEGSFSFDPRTFPSGEQKITVVVYDNPPADSRSKYGKVIFQLLKR